MLLFENGKQGTKVVTYYISSSAVTVHNETIRNKILWHDKERKYFAAEVQCSAVFHVIQLVSLCFCV